MLKERFKLIPESYLLLIRGDEILMHERKNSGYMDGMMSLVAGHVEDGESYIQAMVREAREEAGIEIDAKDLDMKVVLHRKTDRQQIGLYFACKKWTGEPTVMEPDKCGGLRWYKLNALPGNTIPYIRQAIEMYQKGEVYDELGF
jgi:8-oxo-dGTP pyrophosphatase MutT (NUDIX family)